ncbi:MAG: hypothetical protein IPG05_14155 [Gemmatimonadetes bacterium]|nr:hypothetical protein [Gemmatimonadota bacterium]
MLRYRVAALAVLAACWTMTANPLAAQSRPPVPGQPYQYWDVLEADGAARKIYFRNDLEYAITITEVTISRCENTLQVCGTYPAKLLVDPGKTVMAFRVERDDRKLGWSWAYSFRTSATGKPSAPPPSEAPRAMTPTGPIMVKAVPVDSLVPIVAATEENASCGKITVPNLPEGHRAFVMLFGPAKQQPVRMVMVRVDDNNAPYDYRDQRVRSATTSPIPTDRSSRSTSCARARSCRTADTGSHRRCSARPAWPSRRPPRSATRRRWWRG